MKALKYEDKEIKFIRPDGTPAQYNVVWNVTKDGEYIFFEILDLIREKIDGKEKYVRIAIQRVYPDLSDL